MSTGRNWVYWSCMDFWWSLSWEVALYASCFHILQKHVDALAKWSKIACFSKNTALHSFHSMLHETAIRFLLISFLHPMSRCTDILAAESFNLLTIAAVTSWMFSHPNFSFANVSHSSLFYSHICFIFRFSTSWNKLGHTKYVDSTRPSILGDHKIFVL